MTSGVPPAIRREHQDRVKILEDGGHFASELAKIIEFLEDTESSGRLQSEYQQCAALVRAVRSLFRRNADTLRHRRNVQRRADAIRSARFRDVGA